MLESKLWHNKTGTKNVKVGKMWNLSKLVTNTFASLILVFFQLHNPPPFYWGKYTFKSCCMIKTQSIILHGGLSKNEEIHFFGS